jgi:hypothetical protein
VWVLSRADCNGVCEFAQCIAFFLPPAASSPSRSSTARLDEGGSSRRRCLPVDVVLTTGLIASASRGPLQDSITPWSAATGVGCGSLRVRAPGSTSHLWEKTIRTGESRAFCAGLGFGDRCSKTVFFASEWKSLWWSVLRSCDCCSCESLA